jgi:hypothetical protein
MNGFPFRLSNVSTLLVAGTIAAACSSSSGGAATGGAAFTEKVLDVTLSLSAPAGTGGGGGSAGAILTITTKDGATPVMTDAWLYTLENGSLVPLTGFQDPDSKRKYRGLMMPCTLSGNPSGLSPCDDGALDGVMTDSSREHYVNGVKQTAIDGTVQVALDAAPVSTLVVVVAREDQRYAGAAAITPGGQAAPVPAGVGSPETRARLTYTSDVKPILDARCISCHSQGGLAADYPLDTYDRAVNGDYGYTEAVNACKAQYPSDPNGLAACEAGVTKSTYFLEPGNPANSNLLRRSVPDLDKGSSAHGALWWGNKSGARFDAHGDRRMPPTNTTADTSDDVPAAPTYFDDSPATYQVLWSWVAQGAPM